MSQSQETRAKQHLLLQEFTLYTLEAASCILQVEPEILLNETHKWAIIIEKEGLEFRLTGIPDTVSIKETLLNACQTATGKAPLAICCVNGTAMVSPLDPSIVRDAEKRILDAIEQGKAPPVEKLEAFGDEVLEAEWLRRQKQKQKALDRGWPRKPN